VKPLIHLTLFLFTIFTAPTVHAQIGGAEVFEFLELPGSAYAAFGFHKENWETTFNGGIQYITYGDFQGTDEFDNDLGEFKAQEFSINLGASRQVYDRLQVGANLKLITGSLETYNSFGMAMDIGASYQDTSGRFTAGLVFKNVGYQFESYGENREALPFDIQLGITQRLKHLPFRFGVILHNLHRGNVLYDDPNVQDQSTLLGEEIAENKVGVFADNLFRHVIFNGEFLLGKKENFRLRFGYNHFRRQELKVINLTRSLTGFSLGFGIMVKKFRIAYGHQFYHLAGGNNHFSISTALGRW